MVMKKNTIFSLLSKAKITSLIGGILLLITNCAMASTSSGSLPFASKMQTFSDDFNGWLFLASVVMLAAMALMHAFGEWGDGMKKMITAGFWIAGAGGAYSVVALFFGSGAVF